MKIDLCLCNQGDLCKSEGGKFPPFCSSTRLLIFSALTNLHMQTCSLQIPCASALGPHICNFSYKLLQVFVCKLGDHVKCYLTGQSGLENRERVTGNDIKPRPPKPGEL